MEQYTAEDLVRVKWQTAVTSLLSNTKKPDLETLVKSWLTSPVLRPDHSNVIWENTYESLTKKEMIDRIQQIDWPDGLYMIQYSQLDASGFFNRKLKRTWSTWKLIPSEKQELQVSISTTTARRRLQEYLNTFFKNHVYIIPQSESNTCWYRILIFDSRYEETLPARASILIHYLSTEYLLTTTSMIRHRDFLHQATIHAFRAESLKQIPLTSKGLDKLTTLMDHRSSLGIFGQFRYAQQDSMENPLYFGPSSDIPRYEKEQYVGTREDIRRVIPIDHDKIKRRYDHVDQVFGHFPLEGLDSLKLTLEIPVTSVIKAHQTEPVNDDDDDIQPYVFSDVDEPSDPQEDDSDDDHTKKEKGGISMNVTFRGTNVMEGLRSLALQGWMVPPFPPWLSDLVASGSSAARVTNDHLYIES
ncbi:centromere protein Chl4/mis15/CENP-N [Halteromyces radiatus]|uniref:centromere protein Chl4/mis15/CENP-N n=1 Tax=Halteromyces radiatus TaxID=101107 RepID=UPI00221EF378|nr:centromere protein Chl4/mis15/CENP-N [Halteromyces radiatus]KAI8092475.1 centromere protein Chl4/mis15/CENP-N [Halteromyces radiatus]